MPGIVTTTTTTTTTSITKSPVDKLEGEHIFCIGDNDDNDVVTVVPPRHPPPSSRTLPDNDKDKTTSSKIEKETHQSRKLHKDAPGAYTMIHSTVSSPLPSSLSLVKCSLDRQRAGLVQPNPGAYTITHPDFHQENNNNNSTTTLESESEIGSATTFVSPSILTATTTTADDSQILRDRYDTNSHTIQNKEDENEGGGETFLIEAELVKSSIFALEIEPIDEVAEKKRKKKIGIFIAVAFLAVVIACVCVVLLEGKVMTAEEIFLKKHGYKCFTSTQELNYAQISDFIDTNYTKTKDTYVICPDTTINIGVRTGGGVYEDGDYPLRVLTSNTTIQCDATMDDDNYNDNDNDNDKPCVLHGGPAQIMQSENGAVVEDWIYFFRNEGKYLELMDDDVKTFYRMLLPLQNLEYVTIRGLTFSGKILNGVKRYGFSIILNQTGSIIFDECTWKDMTAPTGVVLVAMTSRDYPTTNNTNTKLSTQLTIRNSQFINIEYNHHLIGVYNQMLVLQNTTFTDITIEDFSPPCTDNRWNVESEMTSDKNECLYFMACVGDAICNIKDSCRIDNDNSNYEFLYDNDEWLYESKTTTVQIDDESKECGFY